MGDRFYDDLLTALSSYDFDEQETNEGDYDDEEVNQGKSDELACPFCSEDFDVLGLCCHIDADHRLEVKPGICPVCASKVTINMASHVIVQHENILKALCNKKHGRTAVFLLRKELQEKHLCFIKESPRFVSSSEAATDSVLLSFVNNPHTDYRLQTARSCSSTETSLLAKKSSDNDSSERFLAMALCQIFIICSQFKFECGELPFSLDESRFFVSNLTNESVKTKIFIVLHRIPFIYISWLLQILLTPFRSILVAEFSHRCPQTGMMGG